jgi:hypothetical protein
MKTIPEAMKAYLETHPFDSGSDGCATVLEKLYLAYANSHESDPPKIRKGFKNLVKSLHSLPPSDNNAPAIGNRRCVEILYSYDYFRTTR